MKKLIVLFALFVGSLAVTSCAQTKEVQMDKFQSTYNNSKALIKNKTYTFIGEVVYNNKKREQLEENSSKISIGNTEVTGKIISLSTAKSDADVIGRIEDYKVIFDDERQQIAIQFKVINDLQNLEVFIDIKPNGTTFLTVSLSETINISQVGFLK